MFVLFKFGRAKRHLCFPKQLTPMHVHVSPCGTIAVDKLAYINYSQTQWF